MKTLPSRRSSVFVLAAAVLTVGGVVSQEPVSNDAPAPAAKIDAEVDAGLEAGDQGNLALDGIELEKPRPAETVAASPPPASIAPPPLAVPPPIAAARIAFEDRIEAAATPREVQRIRHEIAQKLISAQINEEITDSERAATVAVFHSIGESAAARETLFHDPGPSATEAAVEPAPRGVSLASPSATYRWLNDYVEPASSVVAGPRPEEITPIDSTQRAWARQVLDDGRTTAATIGAAVGDDPGDAARTAATRAFEADARTTAETVTHTPGTDFFASDQHREQATQAITAAPYFRDEPYLDGSVVDARGASQESEQSGAAENEMPVMHVRSPLSDLTVAPPPPPTGGAAAGDDDLGGVRIGFSQSALSAARGDRLPAEQLEESFITATTEDELRRVADHALAETARRLYGRFDQLHLPRVVSVSLREWSTEVEEHRGRNVELPERLRYPGSLRRVVGYVVEQDDVRVLGTTEGSGRPLDGDDLVVALQTVWRDGGEPACSLDPDPTDFGGPQQVRVLGVPRDSHFAQVMLHADYEMKKVLFGQRAVEVPGFRDLKTRFTELFDPSRKSRAADANLLARFWFTPVPPMAGDVQTTADGRLAVFAARMQLETEAMEVRGASWGGTGRVHPIMQETTASFSAQIDEFCRTVPEFAELQTLFDVVLLSSVLRAAEVRHPVLTRITAWSHLPVEVPSTYPGLTTFLDVEGVVVMALQGGVTTRPAIAPATFAVRYDDGFRRWIDANRGADAALTIFAGRAKATAGGDSAPLMIRRLATTGQADAAVEAATAYVRKRSDDPEAYLLRAEAYASVGLRRLAERDLRLAALLGADVGRLRVLHAKYAWERSDSAQPPTPLAAAERERLADIYFAEAATQAVAGAAEAALGSLERAARLTTRRALVAAWRVRLTAALGLHDEAIRVADDATGEFPKDAVLWLMRAQLQADGDKAEKTQALAWASRAVELDHRSDEALLLRAQLRIAVDALDYEAAGEDVAAARKLSPNHPEIHVMQSRLAVLQGDLDGGLAACNRAIRISPGYVSAYKQRLAVRILGGDSPARYVANLQDCNTVLLIKPDDWPIRAARADLLLKLDQERLAELVRNPQRMQAVFSGILVEHFDRLTILPTLEEPSAEVGAAEAEALLTRIRLGLAEAAAVDFEIAATAAPEPTRQAMLDGARRIRATLKP